MAKNEEKHVHDVALLPSIHLEQSFYHYEVTLLPKNIFKGPNKFIKNTEQADDVGISDGSSPKKSIPGRSRALNINLEPSPSPGPSQKFDLEP